MVPAVIQENEEDFRKFNLGWRFLASKVAFSWTSVERFGKKIWGLMTLGQVKSVPNFC